MWDFDLYFQSLVWHVLEIKRVQERVPSAFVWLVGLGMGNRNLSYQSCVDKEVPLNSHPSP